MATFQFKRTQTVWTKGRTGSVEMTWQASFHVYFYTPRVNDTCHGTIGGFKSNGQRRHIKPGGNACATIPVTRSSIVKLNVLLARYSREWWNHNASTISLSEEKRQTAQVYEPCKICKCEGETFQKKDIPTSKPRNAFINCNMNSSHQLTRCLPSKSRTYRTQWKNMSETAVLSVSITLVPFSLKIAFQQVSLSSKTIDHDQSPHPHSIVMW